MTSPLVSIVTPVYNGAEFLDECVESVRAQTYTNWQYTIIDNCSTDGSLEVAKRHADRDDRIRVVHYDELVPQVQNFNRTLRHVSEASTYCKFVLADDWIFPNCLAEMVRVAELSERVAVVSSYSLYHNRIYHYGIPYAKSPLVAGRDAARAYLLANDWFLGSPNCVLYRSALVRERPMFYNEQNPLCSDAEVFLDLMRTWDFGFVFQVLTYNRRFNESVHTEQEIHNPLLLQAVITLQQFGPEALTPDEYARRRGELDAEYYRFLAVALLKRRDEKFWAFQRKILGLAGLDIDRGRLRREAVKVALEALVNPRKAVEAVVDGLGRARP